jgi:hypothetical protein
MADGAYHEIKASLLRIEDKLEKHGTSLSAIDQHLLNLNGAIVRHEKDIGNLCIENTKIRDEREIYVADWQKWRGSIDTKIILVTGGSMLGIFGLATLKFIRIF